jgi:hypothetical protein
MARDEDDDDFNVAKIMKQSATEQARALISAASENSYLPKLSALLEAGVPANAKDNKGETALFRSAGNGTLKIAARLLEAGADPDLVAVDGLSPRKIAGGSMKKLFAQATTGGGASLRATVDDAKAVRRAKEVIGGILAIAAKLKGHSIYVASLDVEDVKLNSEQAAAEVDEEDRFDPSGFEFAVPLSSKHFKGELETSVLKPKKGLDQRSEDDLVCALVLANKALFASKVKLTKDFKVIAPGHGY